MDTRVIAKLDYKHPYVVKPRQFEGLRKIGSLTSLGVHYQTQGVDELFVSDIVASLYQRNFLTYELEKMRDKISIPVTVGGGVKSLDDAISLLQAGADKVAINTACFETGYSLLTSLAERFGSQATVLQVDVKKRKRWYECYTDGGRNPTGHELSSHLISAVEAGAGEIFVQSVDNDGLMMGFDLELAKLANRCVKVPVVIGSGAGNSAHVLKLLSNTDVHGIMIASAFHYNRLTVTELKSNFV